MNDNLSHTQFSDSEFITQFEDCTLNPEIFSHEAHLRLAWIHIRKYGVELATMNIQHQLLKFVESVGERGKYNKTLTITAVLMVNHFLQHSNASEFSEFILEFPRLKTDFKGLINSHYSFDIFNSKKAKSQFVEPDLLPFN